MKNNQITVLKRNYFWFFFLFTIIIIFLIVINFHSSLKKINDEKTTISTATENENESKIFKERGSTAQVVNNFQKNPSFVFERSLSTQTVTSKIISQVKRTNVVKYLTSGNIEITSYLQNGNIERIYEFLPHELEKDPENPIYGLKGKIEYLIKSIVYDYETNFIREIHYFEPFIHYFINTNSFSEYYDKNEPDLPSKQPIYIVFGEAGEYEKIILTKKTYYIVAKNKNGTITKITPQGATIKIYCDGRIERK